MVPDVQLAHFPLRSPKQARIKAAVGSLALRGRGWRKPFEGYHWLDLHVRLQEMEGTGTPISLSELTAQTVHFYGGDRCTVMPAPKPLPAPVLRYDDLIDIDPSRLVSASIESFLDRLDRTKFHYRNISVARTCFGPMMYLDSDAVIGRSLRLYGEWAANEIRFLRPFCPPGGIVIDVGANIGTHTVAFAQFVGPRGQVLALEPQRVVFQLLCGNIALNNLWNVLALPLAAGSAPGTAHVPVMLAGNVGALELGDSTQGEPVQIIPLDQLATPSVSLIKIDVEGMEREVLEGAREMLRRHRPTLFVENNKKDKSQALLRCLFDLGYRCWWHFEPYYNPNNIYGNRQDVFTDGAGRPEINLLCLPRERESAHIEGLREVQDIGEVGETIWDIEVSGHTKVGKVH